MRPSWRLGAGHANGGAIGFAPGAAASYNMAMIDSPHRHAWMHAGVALALAFAMTGVGCKTNSRTETNRQSALDASGQPAFATAADREPVTAPLAFEETTTTTTTTEYTEVVVEEREPAVLTIGEPTPSPVASGAAPTPPPVAPPPAPASRTHTIAPGDTLSELSQQYLGTAGRWPEIVEANPGIDPNRLMVGDEIVIPGGGPSPAASSSAGGAALGGGTTHTIAAGDTLSQISQRYYGTAARWQEILDANPGVSPTRLIVGNELVIP
ncbi:MAG: LysM domain-containing protein [Planctomycetota bacterium]